MAFPSSPTNTQTATVGGITYTYASATNSWTRVANNLGNIATISLNGNASTILYGNGVFASAPISYSDSNVAAYLVSNPPAGTYSNSNVSSYLTANPPAGTYSNSNATSLLGSFGSNSIVSTGNITIGNISVSGTITDTSGDLTISTTGGTNGNIVITADGTGRITLDGMKWPLADGTSSQVLSTDGAGNLSWATASGGGGGGGATLSTVAGSTTYYVGMSATSSGAWSDARVDTTNLYYSSGSQTLFATNYNTSSDETVKTNIHTIEDALAIVMLLRGVGFDWLATGLKSYGVIAQELEKHIPDLVTTINGKKTVNYNAIIGFLIEAIKSQTTSIKMLEARVDVLENKDVIQN